MKRGIVWAYQSVTKTVIFEEGKINGTKRFCDKVFRSISTICNSFKGLIMQLGIPIRISAATFETLLGWQSFLRSNSCSTYFHLTPTIQ